MRLGETCKKRLKLGLAAIFIAAVSLAIGLVWGYYRCRLEFSVKEVRDGGDGYSFIDPLLDVEFYSPSSEAWAKKAKKEVIDFISLQEGVEDVAFYYRDLNNGPWFGLGERDAFVPASLLKLPLAIAYFKAMENDPSLAEKELACSEGLCTDSEIYDFVPAKKVEVGKSYKVYDLIERMLVYSDNAAKTVLLYNMDQDFLAKVYTDLAVAVPNPGSSADFMSAKEYSSFFRVLYNASYLNRRGSNELLEMLSRVDFRSGLVSGLPNGVVVSHKFGERGFLPLNSQKQLHDCGIVYHTKHPYILCVMTRGGDYQDLAKTIAGISKIVYDNIQN
jgi:beta-lactamase class A